MKFILKPVEVEAIRWWKNGDHPEDDCFRPWEDTGKVPTTAREGKVVRYFRDPTMSGEVVCALCRRGRHSHGWIDLVVGGYTVCPGDWVVKFKGGYYKSYSPSAFNDLYVPVKDA